MAPARGGSSLPVSPVFFVALLSLYLVCEGRGGVRTHAREADYLPRLVGSLRTSYTINPKEDPWFEACLFIGYPSPVITWRRNDVSLPNRAVPSGPFFFPNGTLVLENAHPDDSGLYYCVGSNRAGATTESTNITIVLTQGPLVWVQWWMYFVYGFAVWAIFTCVLMTCCCYFRKPCQQKGSKDTPSEVDGMALSPTTVIPPVQEPLSWAECSYTESVFHLIDLSPHTHYNEWTLATDTLKNTGYIVQKVQRIQNLTLWSRYQFEKRVIKRGKRNDFDMHEALLYHATITEKESVCEHGLDHKSNRTGMMFGEGIYFSDSPEKCNRYWHLSTSHRLMFACYVLLGEIKEYPPGRSHGSLKKEPRRSLSVARPLFYDSVKGNMDGYDEYVVYKSERAYPAYAIEYTVPRQRPASTH